MYFMKICIIFKRNENNANIVKICVITNIIRCILVIKLFSRMHYGRYLAYSPARLFIFNLIIYHISIAELQRMNAETEMNLSDK